MLMLGGDTLGSRYVYHWCWFYSHNILLYRFVLKLQFLSVKDVVHQFERVYRRGGGAAGVRVTAERKLSILDKALKQNPECEELLRERCLLAESVLPADRVCCQCNRFLFKSDVVLTKLAIVPLLLLNLLQLTMQLKTWIAADAGNLVLWEALIMASQGSLSTCKVPQVKCLYQEALTNINSLKKGNNVSAKAVENKLIGKFHPSQTKTKKVQINLL